ncbi:MAG: SCP2 sterol-binding domain-containing protein [Myxococcaceae bacterium]
MSWLDTLEDIRKKDFSKVPVAQRDKAARDVVNMASYGCAVVAVSPIPFSDAVLSLPMQTGMVMTVGHVYGRKVTQADAKSLILELGTVAGAGMLARQGIKALLPVVGALLTVPAAFAMNWAIGRVAMEYFKNPGMPKEQLRKVFELAREEGSKLFSMERFNAFRKSKTAAVKPEEVAEADEAPKVKKTVGKAKKPAAKKLSKLEKIITKDFDAKLGKHPEVRKAVAGVIHLDITGDDGGQWTADLTRSKDFISEGLEGEPRLTVRCSASDFGDLLKGRKDAQMAVLAGDLELEPMDLDLVGKLAPLFS